MKRVTIAVSVGCPSGIGPEVAVHAAANAEAEARCVLVGDAETLRRAAHDGKIAAARFRVVKNAPEIESLALGEIGVWGPSTQLSSLARPGAPDREAGAVQLAWVNEALALVTDGTAAALVTGPVSKFAIATSGARGAKGFSGHTEHLAARLGAREVVMAFRAANITTALVTTHLPLAEVPTAVTPEAVSTSCYWLVRLLRSLGMEAPRVAVAALNPHAGEGGMLGIEEETCIKPGIERANERLSAGGFSATLAGPLGAETAFRKQAAGAFDGVVAMYHDQATIPCKLVGFGEAVNVTLGLPVIRTSVDHGTGYDIAGMGKADPRGMESALGLALRLAKVEGRASLTARAS
ncbi:4-hydroxythreonine-4-phosphate dehydrogenase PdxA [Polyangium jinanense]|uniref:4-hydroxythreonine-4-phosphate dehydrogenase PdxA n=1 Tax=Polyangium jinanense TaxID=2829994 RepID=A0A9X3WXI5_9BACT|nr:4-hydroxythreonine-4-phosphate dehydrogenase PdxA [Polyangium jinanense]MDC3952466.1 4-hydroxythreonine-4-phosphate dehydrogenase PdxA [Polyangium jinanense]MDC3980094.1 4-hydroxythreonine-4-phosphate dehydrogenase PdxA [Polyangium jinanense]